MALQSHLIVLLKTSGRLFLETHDRVPAVPELMGLPRLVGNYTTSLKTPPHSISSLFAVRDNKKVPSTRGIPCLTYFGVASQRWRGHAVLG